VMESEDGFQERGFAIDHKIYKKVCTLFNALRLGRKDITSTFMPRYSSLTSTKPKHQSLHRSNKPSLLTLSHNHHQNPSPPAFPPRTTLLPPPPQQPRPQAIKSRPTTQPNNCQDLKAISLHKHKTPHQA